jgi:hypothetical protein
MIEADFSSMLQVILDEIMEMNKKLFRNLNNATKLIKQALDLIQER